MHAVIAAAIIVFLATLVYIDNGRLNTHDMSLERLALFKK